MLAFPWERVRGPRGSGAASPDAQANLLDSRSGVDRATRWAAEPGRLVPAELLRHRHESAYRSPRGGQVASVWTCEGAHITVGPLMDRV
jgi:hypothetical protein